jgi:hypothetical protein
MTDRIPIRALQIIEENDSKSRNGSEGKEIKYDRRVKIFLEYYPLAARG